MININDFAIEHQNELWSDPTHRRSCLMQVSRFNDYCNADRDLFDRNMPMSDITTALCVKYRKALQHSGLRTSTINRHLAAISGCLRFALELGVIDNRPKVGMVKEDEPDTKAFTRDQVQLMVSYHTQNGDDWLADMIKLACMTGMRLGEIVALPDVAIDTQTKELWLTPEITKTKRGRFVSLAAGNALEVAQRLQRCIGAEYTHRRFRRRWDDVKSRMGFRGQEWFKFHATRHYAATNMAKAKVNVLVVAEQLGHRSIATTQKYYHGDAEARASAVSALAL